jgi:hypothetical protein
MIEIERSPGQEVCIGPYVLQVVAVHPDHIVFALRGPDEDREPWGQEPAVPQERLAWLTADDAGPAGRILA